jgi:glutamyl-tRNA reductase
MLMTLGVDEEASGFVRKADPIIEAMRQRASEIAREEVDRTMKRIGADPEVEERLSAMAKALVSKLLHAPSARLRQASTDVRSGERLMAAAVEMFGLAVDCAPTGQSSDG